MPSGRHLGWDAAEEEDDGEERGERRERGERGERVLEDNPRTRRFYEPAGRSLDGASKKEEHLGLSVRELRYRISVR
jgi:hypothetical protein